MNVGKQILFADSDPNAQSTHQDRLQRDGYSLQAAADGVTALKIISGATPDLVVLDLKLPKLNGGEVFKFMRLEPRLKNVPVILFTNGSTMEWPKNVPPGPIRCVPERAANYPLLPELIQEMLETPATPAAAVVPEQNGKATANKNDKTNSPAMTAMPDLSEPVPMTRVEFLTSALQELPKLHENYMLYLRAPTTPSGQQNLGELRERLGGIRSDAERTGCAHVALLARVMNELLADLAAKPARTTPSLSQTLAQSFDCLRFLLNNEEEFHGKPIPVPRVLSVDDDEICNQVSLSALERINAAAECAESADAALQMLRDQRYDLALLDINMPGLNGFQLCEQLRGISHCKNMPIIFITAFNNFNNRKQSVLNGAEDFITKPVYAFELALKVTICLLKKRQSQDPDEARQEIEMLAATIGAPGTLETKPNNKVETKVETTIFTKSALQMKGAPTVTATSFPPAETEAAAEPAPKIPEPAIAFSRPTPAAAVESIGKNGGSSVKTPRATTATTPAPAPAAAPAMAAVKSTESPVATPKPARTEPTPAKSPNQNENRTMKPEKNARFEALVNEVSQLIFGSAATDLNQRLVRMALEQVCQNGTAPQSFETVATQVARLIFGESNASELNVRLVRMALERAYSGQ